MDPRPAIVDRRLRGVARIVAVTGGKGGIGKSSVSVGLSLALAGSGKRVGLLDLDLWGPSDHVILGVPRPGLHEDGGLVPDAVAGISFLSIASIVGDEPAILRGSDITNAILELLAVTIWDGLDVLVVDMPPGFGDTVLDAARYLSRAAYIVVTTPSELTAVTTRKTVEVLRRLDLPILGMVVNLLRPGAQGRAPVAGTAPDGVPVLGTIAYDDGYEAALGDPGRLRGTAFYREAAAVADAVATLPAPVRRRGAG